MSSFDQTMKFNFPEEPIEHNVKEVLLQVYDALQEKGYNPINQIVGYLLSGDPAYIPRHKDARNLIRKLERDEIMEEVNEILFKGSQKCRIMQGTFGLLKVPSSMDRLLHAINSQGKE